MSDSMTKSNAMINQPDKTMGEPLLNIRTAREIEQERLARKKLASAERLALADELSREVQFAPDASGGIVKVRAELMTRIITAFRDSPAIEKF